MDVNGVRHGALIHISILGRPNLVHYGYTSHDNKCYTILSLMKKNEECQVGGIKWI